MRFRLRSFLWFVLVCAVMLIVCSYVRSPSARDPVLLNTVSYSAKLEAWELQPYDWSTYSGDPPPDCFATRSGPIIIDGVEEEMVASILWDELAWNSPFTRLALRPYYDYRIRFTREGEVVEFLLDFDDSYFSVYRNRGYVDEGELGRGAVRILAILQRRCDTAKALADEYSPQYSEGKATSNESRKE